MADEHAIDLLSQLLVRHYRSLPMFLTESAPWVHRGDEEASHVLIDIVASQKMMCRRLASEIEQRGGIVELGEYPTDFLDFHFLSLDYMLQRLCEYQRKEIVCLARSAEQLYADPAASAIAKEALGAARGHLESLEELLAKIPQNGS